MIRLADIFVSLILPYTPSHVLSPSCHSSFFQMAEETRQQELLNSERLSLYMDEWMGDHVFTLLFLVFCF